MTSQALHRPFIGITLYQEDYHKVQGFLPTPSYRDILYSRDNQKVTLIYAIEGYITSPAQYRWISNIKLGLREYLYVPFAFEETFIITDTTEINHTVYEIKALSKAFKAPLIHYPKIMYPSTKQELYRRLCWYGQRLIHQHCFTHEIMTATALLMNAKLKEKYSTKELHKKALGACMWIEEHREGFTIGLDEVALKKAHSKGGQKRRAQRVQQTKEKIQQCIKSGDYIKPNGKVNISSLAKALNMTRKTIAKYV